LYNIDKKDFMKYLFMLLLAFNSEDIPSGSLIFAKDSNFIVEQFTQSDITHVAIVAKENNEAYVFEADKPKVRKILLSEYLKKTKVKLYISVPNEKFDNEKLVGYLNSQLNKKYSIENYNKKRPSDKTVFCSQLVVDCYNHCNVKIFTYPSQYYAPGDVWNVIIDKNVSSVHVLKEKTK